ncbi:hypothetical protein WG908_09160 [Sphingobium sp. AN641]|uniref:hypothetical protein n=1 Tax=Sphingobium sp. AN641 TaxID=3133443 RepID=UPI0030BA9338
MFDIFYGWSRLIASGWSLAGTGLRALETMGAANDVVTARTAIIGSAMRSPHLTDHAELARMVPEKINALSRAGSDTMSAWWSGQAAWTGPMRDVALMTMRGRWPTPGELVRLGNGMTRLALETLDAPARMSAAALAPIHRKATGNARRLRRKGVSLGGG